MAFQMSVIRLIFKRAKKEATDAKIKIQILHRRYNSLQDFHGQVEARRVKNAKAS